MEALKFTKMHGIGNDYVYIDCTASCPDNLEDLARRMSDRHTGIGGDGLVLILPSEIADFKMRIFNAVGSEARMCGNASRCIGKYVYDRGLTDRENITLETLSGVKYLSLALGNDGKVESVTVDMGEPEFIPELIPVLADRNLAIPAEADGGEMMEINAVSTGNPHGVVFVDDLDAFGDRVLTAGPALENHPMWPDRANIEFTQVISPSEIKMRVWERGSGETMACGTGACATAVAAAVTGRAGREVTVHLRGGDLKIRWDEASNRVFMTGPATIVFDGTYYR